MVFGSIVEKYHYSPDPEDPECQGQPQAVTCSAFPKCSTSQTEWPCLRIGSTAQSRNLFRNLLKRRVCACKEMTELRVRTHGTCMCKVLPCLQQAWSLEHTSSAPFTQPPPDLCYWAEHTHGKDTLPFVHFQGSLWLQRSLLGHVPQSLLGCPFLNLKLLLYTKLQGEAFWCSCLCSCQE